jgi:hypothetical protein
MENLNYAVLCGKMVISNPQILGLHSENITVCEDDLLPCPTDTVYINKCGDLYKVVQTAASIWDMPIDLEYDITSRISIEHSLYHDHGCGIKGVIINANFMKMNIPRGKVYLNYEGILEDEEGNLLVVDHPLINDYYEYALKRRVLENLYFKGEDVERKLQLVELRYREARKQALGIANTPEFKEIEEVVQLNRRAAFQRYYSVFV